MRKIFLFIIVLFPLIVDAQNFIYDGVYYSIKLFTKNVGVASSNSTKFYKGYITIPETVVYKDETYTVVSVDNGAFTGSDELLGVALPNTITSIGDRAFSGCNGLTVFVIPQNVSIIGEDAFYGSKNIKEIHIPKSVTSIGCRAFSNLEKLVLEDGEKPLKLITYYSINDNTPFHICPLVDIYLGRNLDYTNKYAPFRDNTKLENVVIGDSVSEVGPYLFNGCTGLKEINISSNLKSIMNYAFSGCSGLTKIEIPKNVDYIGMNVFYGSSIKEIEIEDGKSVLTFESFLHSPFTYCPIEKVYLGRNIIANIFNNDVPFTKSNEVVIGDSVTSINDNLFKKCEGLSKIEIGMNVTNIGNESFGGCNSINDIYCYAPNVPNTSISAFKDSPISQASLYVPNLNIEQYRATKPWSDFKSIKGLSEESAIDIILSNKEYIDTYISIDGKKKNHPSQGVNIIRTTNGTFKKVLMK